ncbi:uncharacterized protein I303_105322 [Kwoniella dejecticola CBS 10117]|uniref:Telomere-associated protein Rif1 N-terminal domain-containing protein n=1 Tax=Kwoniella dejecticola CBS 10117 TaxID=1296121 RepID=A0A1A6A2U5_9TREE|nr:uncharacterized protein I303_05231 [Kwoniella dejecticola CBS 10117]OBR84373.1 hypothetical protein I303_05231 [Kwoniella dejecticola CBS 10117]
MSILSSPRSHVSFDTDVDTHIGSSSSVLDADENDALVATSSNPVKQGISPLGPSKTIPALNKRGVIFSPRNDTKYFHSDDLILSSPALHSTPKPPASIRSYSDPITPNDSPSRSNSQQAGVLSDTPLLVRSILRFRLAQQIRLASTVEEGTLNNKEAARLIVSGKRPRLLARDSFQLAMMRNAAADGNNGSRRGKGKVSDQIPSSDDSNGSTGIPTDGKDGDDEAMIGGESSEEEEETLEEDGALSTASLINIILDGAEDLLTLEEAYSTLTLRLRNRIPTDVNLSDPLSPSQLDDIRISTQPLRDEAPAMVRAIQRDLQRLLGKLPATDIGSSDSDMSPFRQLMPLRDTPPAIQRGRLTPSPTPGKSSSPTKAARQGYTEAEVRYRREASGVGAAVLRLLAFIFHTPHLFACFSDADLTSLLEQVMMIPRTPKLPTPNPKRTYYLSIVILSQMNLSSACVQPVKDKIVRAVEGAMNDTLGAMGGINNSGKEGPSAVKKEGFSAVTNLVSNYPSLLFPHYTDLLEPCLRAMASGNNVMRYKAGSAVSAFARAKFAILATAEDDLTADPANSSLRETYGRVKALSLKSEYFVISHLKAALKVPGKNSPIYGKDGEKKLEWHSLEQIFKDTVGSMTDVHWACAAWSVIVTLMGSAYASSGLANGFDHIMDRSLQPSTNVVRPHLARVAWNHAMHAYLSAGSASSVSEDGKLIRSFKPFAASSQQTIEQRTAKIQFPVDLALEKATDKASYARALTTAKPGVESHYIWQRSEKSKKLGWVTTCGYQATAVVYAYTGMALYHEDQPAKELSQITGIPSSDGINPDTDMAPSAAAEEVRLPRLDAAWEKVVNPMLRSFFNICGVDKLTIHSWQILDAITAPPLSSTETSNWDLDKLLVSRYMSGEMFASDREPDFSELLLDIQEDELSPSDIPSWGQFWAAKRLGRLLILFDEALTSIHGINNTSDDLEWVNTANDVPVLPVILSNIWRKLILALKSAKLANAPPTPLFLVGLQTVTQHLTAILNRDPKTYVPFTRIGERGRCILDEDELRIGLFDHLFNTTLEVLGEDLMGSIRLHSDSTITDHPQAPTSVFSNAFGADANSNPTVCGALLGQLLRIKLSSITLQPPLQENLKSLVSRFLDVACVPGYAGKLLGDITNAMPFLFEDREEVQLDIWRLLAVKWTEIIDLQPVSSTSSTNHTGALLVSLLSGPFRGRSITSYWHQKADSADLKIWQNLLEVTVLRFRAKRFGSNCGVLEALAGRLDDFTGETQNDKTRSTTITLSCLASAISHMSFPLNDADGHSQNSEWVISDADFVPTDFLAFINSALIEAYPSNETTSGTQETITKTEYSPAAFDLLENVATVLSEIPEHFVGKVLQPLMGGLTIWLEDKEGIVDEEGNHKLDNLYVSLLETLSKSIPSPDLPLSSTTLNELAELYIPRISRATSSAVPKAFQSFWSKTFAESRTPLTYSEDVADFLRDLLSAVPGMIICPGLEGDSQLSQEESLQRFPHVQLTFPPLLAQAEECNEDVEMEEFHPSYDGDVSQSFEQTLQPVDEEDGGDQYQREQQAQRSDDGDILVDATRDDILIDTTTDEVLINAATEDVLVDATRDEIPPPSPSPLLQVPDEKQESIEDVFGPAAMTKTVNIKPKKRGGRRTKGKKRSLATAQTEESLDVQSLPIYGSERGAVEVPANSHSLPDLSVPFEQDSGDEGGSCIIVAPSPDFYRRRGLPVPSASEPEEAVESVQDAPENDPADAKSAELEEVEQEAIEEEIVTPAEDNVDLAEEVETDTEDNGEEVHTRQRSTRSVPVVEIPPVDAPSRSSLFKGWLSRVPSFPFFSPSTSDPPAATQPEPLEKQAESSPLPDEVPSDATRTAQSGRAKQDNGKSGKSKGRRGGRKKNSSSKSVSILNAEPLDHQQQILRAQVEETEVKANVLPDTVHHETIDSVSSSKSRSKGKRKAAEIDSVSLDNDQLEVMKESIPDQAEDAEPRRSKRRKAKVSPQTSADRRPSDAPQSGVSAQTSIVIEDDEDELLLSPESARRRKREEEAEIQIRASQSHSLPQSQSQAWSESISGRFDDAEGDLSIQPSLPIRIQSRPALSREPSSPSMRSKRARTRSKSSSSSNPDGSLSLSLPRSSGLPAADPSTASPAKRTTEQAQLMRLLDDAAKSKQLIENLDYHGVKSLLKNLNTLREAAEERMISRMEEYRNARR